MKKIYTKRNFPEVPKGSKEQISDWFNGFFFQFHFGNFHQIQEECSFRPFKQLLSLLLLRKCWVISLCICKLQCTVAFSYSLYWSGMVNSLAILTKSN